MTASPACWLFGIAQGCFCEPCGMLQARESRVGSEGGGRRWRESGLNTGVASREGELACLLAGEGGNREVKRSRTGTWVGFLERGEGWRGMSQVLPVEWGSSDALLEGLCGPLSRGGGKDAGRWRDLRQRRPQKSEWHVCVFCYTDG